MGNETWLLLRWYKFRFAVAGRLFLQQKVHGATVADSLYVHDECEASSRYALYGGLLSSRKGSCAATICLLNDPIKQHQHNVMVRDWILQATAAEAAAERAATAAAAEEQEDVNGEYQ